MGQQQLKAGSARDLFVAEEARCGGGESTEAVTRGGGAGGGGPGEGGSGEVAQGEVAPGEAGPGEAGTGGDWPKEKKGWARGRPWDPGGKGK